MVKLARCVVAFQGGEREQRKMFPSPSQLLLLFFQFSIFSTPQKKYEVTLWNHQSPLSSLWKIKLNGKIITRLVPAVLINIEFGFSLCIFVLMKEAGGFWLNHRAKPGSIIDFACYCDICIKNFFSNSNCYLRTTNHDSR